MRIIDLACKDIVQTLRDWKSALFLVIMPVAFTFFFGLIFNPLYSGEGEGDPRLPVGLVNEDPGGLLSEGLVPLLEQSEVIRPVLLEGEEANRASDLVAEGEFTAVLRVPSGYSQAFSAGKAASLDIIADEGTIAGRTAVTALETAANRLFSAVESAHISLEAYQDRSGFSGEAVRQAYFQEAFRGGISAWSEPPFTARVELATGDVPTAEPGEEINGFTQSSAGMIVQFAIFGLITSAMVLVLERKTGSVNRLLTTPIRRAEIICGHVLGMFLVVFAQETILVALGQFAFGVDYLRQPLAILLMMVSLALWAASLGLLIGVVARKEEQVILLCLVAMFVFSALGGAWFPLEVSGKAFSAVGHLFPSAWAMDGFQNIIMRGLGFSSVLLPVGALLAYTLAFFGIAVWKFRR